MTRWHWKTIRDHNGRLLYVSGSFRAVMIGKRWRIDRRVNHSWTAVRSRPYGPHNSRNLRLWASSLAAKMAAEKMQTNDGGKR